VILVPARFASAVLVFRYGHSGQGCQCSKRCARVPDLVPGGNGLPATMKIQKAAKKLGALDVTWYGGAPDKSSCTEDGGSMNLSQ
jgi:hypothetical protein